MISVMMLSAVLLAPPVKVADTQESVKPVTTMLSESSCCGTQEVLPVEETKEKVEATALCGDEHCTCPDKPNASIA